MWKRCLSHKGTCHVILLAKLHDMYLYKTATFPDQPLKSVSKVAFLHRFHCSVLSLLCFTLTFWIHSYRYRNYSKYPKISNFVLHTILGPKFDFMNFVSQNAWNCKSLIWVCTVSIYTCHLVRKVKENFGQL